MSWTYIISILQLRKWNPPENRLSQRILGICFTFLFCSITAMPFELYWLWRQYPWVFGEAICDAKMLTTETVTYSSILTIVAFTVERWVMQCTIANPITVIIIWNTSFYFTRKCSEEQKEEGNLLSLHSILGTWQFVDP